MQIPRIVSSFRVLFGGTNYEFYSVTQDNGCATALRRLVAGLNPRPGHVGFVADKLTLRRVFSECFGFSLHQLLHTPGLIQQARQQPFCLAPAYKVGGGAYGSLGMFDCVVIRLSKATPPAVSP
jgi:hypothetical protein